MLRWRRRRAPVRAGVPWPPRPRWAARSVPAPALPGAPRRALPPPPPSGCVTGRSPLTPRVGADFGHRLRIGERAEFGRHALGDGRRFAARLEAGEVRTVAPCQWAT